MKAKSTIRYIRFRPSEDGGRIFDFWVTESERPDRDISVRIPVTFFEGQNRLHLQEGVGISYAKLRHFLELAESSEQAPEMLCFDATDLAMHRPTITKRKHGSVLPR
jgi:hypothetical protein